MIEYESEQCLKDAMNVDDGLRTAPQISTAHRNVGVFGSRKTLISDVTIDHNGDILPSEMSMERSTGETRRGSANICRKQRFGDHRLHNEHSYTDDSSLLMVKNQNRAQYFKKKLHSVLDRLVRSEMDVLSSEQDYAE
jgi:hypothetical protein